MTIDEAIEILTSISQSDTSNLNNEGREALQLGIAALYRIKYQRKKPTVPHKTLLPGETEE